MYNQDNYLAQVMETPFVIEQIAFCFFCSDLAVFIIPMLFAYFKDPILNWDRVPALRAGFHRAHVLSILLPQCLKHSLKV